MGARAEDPRRACPAGASRGVDVARMYPEISAIVRAKFQAAGVDIDELVQETAAAILRKNTSPASAFDPARSSFGHYVHLVARSKVGHMAGSAARRAHGPVLLGDELLDVAGHDDAGAEVEASARTAGELAELLADQAARARALAAEARAGRDEASARYQEGAADGLRCVAELLGSFADEAPLPPPRARRRAPPAAPPAAVEEAKIRGWKSIAAALDVEERKARHLVNQGLKVREDHKGVWILPSVLEAWMRSRDRAWSRA